MTINEFIKKFKNKLQKNEKSNPFDIKYQKIFNKIISYPTNSNQNTISKKLNKFTSISICINLLSVFGFEEEIINNKIKIQ